MTSPHQWCGPVIWFISQIVLPWWRHQMETFSALLAICAGNSPVPGEFPTQRPVTRSFDVYFDLRPNKWLSKQPWGWWFETLSCSLWRHRNDRIRYGVRIHENTIHGHESSFRDLAKCSTNSEPIRIGGHRLDSDSVAVHRCMLIHFWPHDVTEIRSLLV